jgi:hypothetical protein
MPMTWKFNLSDSFGRNPHDFQRDVEATNPAAITLVINQQLPAQRQVLRGQVDRTKVSCGSIARLEPRNRNDRTQSFAVARATIVNNSNRPKAHRANARIAPLPSTHLAQIRTRPFHLPHQHHRPRQWWPCPQNSETNGLQPLVPSLAMPDRLQNIEHPCLCFCSTPLPVCATFTNLRLNLKFVEAP